MTKFVFLDIESTGLDPEIHDVWEIGIITDAGREYVWQIRPDLTQADPRALEVGRYWQRAYTRREDCSHIPDAVGIGVDMTSEPLKADTAEGIASDIAPLIAGAVVVGSNPKFDEAFLSRWLRKHGQVWAAHYRTIDVVTLGWGKLMGIPGEGTSGVLPSSHSISCMHGVDPDDYARHTALGDAKWARDLYAAITGKA